MAGSRPKKHLLEWYLDWIPPQEKLDFLPACPQGFFLLPKNMDFLVACPRFLFFSKNSDFLVACPQGLFLPQKSPDFPPTCPQVFCFLRKVRISRQHARRGFIFPTKVRISYQGARRGSQSCPRAPPDSPKALPRGSLELARVGQGPGGQKWCLRRSKVVFRLDPTLGYIPGSRGSPGSPGSRGSR